MSMLKDPHKLLAQRLGRLLGLSHLAPQIKESIRNILPRLTYKQISSLISILDEEQRIWERLDEFYFDLDEEREQQHEKLLEDQAKKLRKIIDQIIDAEEKKAIQRIRQKLEIS